MNAPRFIKFAVEISIKGETHYYRGKDHKPNHTPNKSEAFTTNCPTIINNLCARTKATHPTARVIEL